MRTHDFTPRPRTTVLPINTGTQTARAMEFCDRYGLTFGQYLEWAAYIDGAIDTVSEEGRI